MPPVIWVVKIALKHDQVPETFSTACRAYVVMNSKLPLHDGWSLIYEMSGKIYYNGRD